MVGGGSDNGVHERAPRPRPRGRFASMSDASHTAAYPDLADDDAYEQAIGTLTDLTDALMDDIKALDDDGVRAPSCCEGWSRGHVLAHVARNADAFGNLLTWASTGVETPMYPSVEARNADIDAGAGRSASELESDVESSAERLLAGVAALPLDRRHVAVRGGSGAEMLAHDVLWTRIREVAYHHVDLRTRYSFAHLPDWVVARGLDESAERLTDGDAPPLTLVATDAALEVAVSDGGAVVRGRASDLLAWTTGRSDGADLESDGPLPALPSWG